MDPGRVGGTQARAQVVRIGDSIQDQKQRAVDFTYCAEKIVLVPGLERPHRGYRPLMCHLSGELRERVAAHGLHPDSRRLRPVSAIGPAHPVAARPSRARAAAPASAR